MNMLLFDENDLHASSCLEGFEISISGARLQRLKALLQRLPRGGAAGDFIRVGQLGGRVGRGEILRISDEHAQILVTLDALPPPKLSVTLILALPRPKMLRRILRFAGELGVQSLVLINTQRVEKSYWQTPVLQMQTMKRYLIEGLAQTGDTVLPELRVHRGFKDFVADHLGLYVKGCDFLVAHPGDFPPCPASSGRNTCLAVGPESGFTAFEIDQFVAQGAELISLGPRVLRVETAVPVLLSRMML